ncbi:hypothetical protein F183_A26350 [Bryobacterales bacterium F-183]|nr:hypothetical protein F183_A26350 [Bryobacterales bacterium F-183]
MSNPVRTDYDVVEYPHRPFAQTQPDRLAVIGTLFGMQPALPDRCRVLELGGGSGGNLIPLADLFPNSTFFGVDLAQTAINQGQKRIDALGLKNIRLQRMDVMEFPADAGEFDYIIAHGLFSWVPDFVRDKVLQICQDHLAPQGIAYISYNAYPGCHIRQMWRDMMVFHTRQFTEPNDKVQQAKGMMNLVANGCTRQDPAHMLAKDEVEKRSKLDDSAIFHDDLSPVWQPFYVTEFLSLAGAKGLRFLGEATYSDLQPTTLTPEALAQFGPMRDADPVIFEQYMDFFKMRKFRQTLLCRASVPVQPADPNTLRSFHFTAPIQQVPVQDPNAPPGTAAFRHGINEVTVTTNNPVTLPALRMLADRWPSSSSFTELAAASGDGDALCPILHSFYASSFLNLHSIPRKLGGRGSDKPEVWRVARFEATLDRGIPHLHHGAIELEDDATRQLVSLMDGTRTRAELALYGGGPAQLDATIAKMVRAGILIR